MCKHCVQLKLSVFCKIQSNRKTKGMNANKKKSKRTLYNTHDANAIIATYAINYLKMFPLICLIQYMLLFLHPCLISNYSAVKSRQRRSMVNRWLSIGNGVVFQTLDESPLSVTHSRLGCFNKLVHSSFF